MYAAPDSLARSAASRFGRRPGRSASHARRARLPPLTRLVVLGATLLAIPACEGSEPPPPPPLDIQVTKVIQRDQPIVLEMVGETLGSSDIPVRTRVEGILTGLFFTEGRAVEKDQLLYTIDPDTYVSQVVEAKGGLAEAETRLVKAKSDLERVRPLAEINAISQSDLDGAVARYEAALGTLQSSRARVEQSEIQLAYTRIHAPISGRIGISKAKVGEFVGRDPNPVVLNFVSKTDPVRVRFAIDERRYLILARRLNELQGQNNETSKMGSGLQLTLTDGSLHPYPGRVVAADAAIDPKTGTFTFEADFPNPENFVRAGQFARVRAIAETKKDALLIPSRAISELQGIFRVHVVGADGKVQMRQVVVRESVGNLRIIESGVSQGEQVAVEIAKLRDGMTVNPVLVEVDEAGNLIERDPEDQDMRKDGDAGKAGA